MNQPWENPDKAKATVTIDKDLYIRVKKKLHYGQFSALFRNIFESIDSKIQSGEIIDIINYIYKEKSLTLKPLTLKSIETNHDSDE